MRQIAFRVFNTIEKRYDPSDQIVLTPYGNVFWYSASDNCGYDFEDITEKVVVEFFTGLLDKNGKEIYEGDIVKKHDTYRKYNGKIGEVRYATHTLGEFVIHTDEDTWAFYYPDGSNFYPEQLEVIGNIHENPELLGEQK